jgi:hypothetical protein
VSRQVNNLISVSIQSYSLLHNRIHGLVGNSNSNSRIWLVAARIIFVYSVPIIKHIIDFFMYYLCPWLYFNHMCECNLRLWTPAVSDLCSAKSLGLHNCSSGDRYIESEIPFYGRPSLGFEKVQGKLNPGLEKLYGGIKTHFHSYFYRLRIVQIKERGWKFTFLFLIIFLINIFFMLLLFFIIMYRVKMYRERGGAAPGVTEMSSSCLLQGLLSLSFIRVLTAITRACRQVIIVKCDFILGLRHHRLLHKTNRSNITEAIKTIFFPCSKYVLTVHSRHLCEYGFLFQ